MTTKPKAYSYVRMSTSEQLKGDSLKRQLETSARYADTNGLELVDDRRLADIGISAFKGRNVEGGALGQFLAAVKKKKIEKGSWLIVESLDRLSRQDIRKSQDLLYSITDAGITVVTLSDNHVYRPDKTDMTDMITSIVHMSRAHEESTIKAMRVASAWAKKRDNAGTKKLTTVGPLWLKWSGVEFEPIKRRVKVVQSIFEDSAWGMGNYAIARQLNGAGTPSFTDGTWHEVTIRKLLKNRSVLGEFQPHKVVDGKRIAEGDPIKDYFPRVIDEKLFYRAQQGREQRRTTLKGRRGENISNLFSGIARCAYCAEKMFYINKGATRGSYLICSSAHKGTGCLRTGGWRYEEFEKSFLAFVSELDLVGVLNSDAKKQARSQVENEITALRGKLASINEQMENAFALMSGPTKDFATKKLQTLGDEQANVTAQIQEKEKELESLRAKTAIATDDLIEIIDRVQKGEDNYKLRAEVASKLQSIVKTLWVANEGTGPLIKKAKSMITDQDENEHDDITYIARAPVTKEKFFVTTLDDGTRKAIEPNRDDPLDIWQGMDSKDVESASTLPVNLDAFHLELNDQSK
jgi:DNA invertase Pin-like site-specific DNA recombinase